MSDPLLQDEGPPTSLRHRLYVILEAGKTGDWASRIFDTFMMLLILANVIAFSLETVDRVYARYGAWLELFNVISVLNFYH